MERNIHNSTECTTQESTKKNDAGQPGYFWVSYPDDRSEENTKSAQSESILEKSNRFAL